MEWVFHDDPEEAEVLPGTVFGEKRMHPARLGRAMLMLPLARSDAVPLAGP